MKLTFTYFNGRYYIDLECGPGESDSAELGSAETRQQTLQMASTCLEAFLRELQETPDTPERWVKESA